MIDHRGCSWDRRVVVAIPAKDEAERIGPCVLALARQTRKPDAVVLLLNNCRDGTEAIARELSSRLPYKLHIICHTFPPAATNAGQARRLAMQHAAELAGRDGVLLTTDADAIVATDWVERALRAISMGAELVCGCVDVDPIEAALIPANLHADDAQEREFTRLLDEIALVLDPVPSDPWPRHTEAAGASIAVTVAAFTRAGGMPSIATGEDRAFVATLTRMDARVRHDPMIRVTVSGRIHGRASGGMADTIRRRMRQQDEFTDDCLEPAADAYRRADFRRRVRLAWRDQFAGRVPGKTLSADLGISCVILQQMLQNPLFGAAWAEIEAASPYLIRRRVKFTDLPGQIAYARQLLDQHGGTRANRPESELPTGTEWQQIELGESDALLAVD
jgi:glycosyltransferase involved in cell wall biosynthesis